MADPVKSITVGGQRVPLQASPISGDVAVTHEGISVIGAGKITVDMLSNALALFLFPVAVIGETKIGYCTIG